MSDIPNWHTYFLDLTDAIARRSKDPNTQVGAIIVGPAHEIRSTGYNSFPRHIRDDIPERLVRPEKYRWIEHAERNAIYNAARCGTPTEGCTLYCQIMPCMDCARAVVQTGIRNVIVSFTKHEAYKDTPRWKEEFERVAVLFEEAEIFLLKV
jgi:dCMP deaminase